jgi:hypothetical protein
LEVVKIRKKSKSTNNVAQPTSKQEKEVLMGSAQLLSKDRPSFKGYGTIKKKWRWQR